jgi:hypothetical protein
MANPDILIDGVKRPMTDAELAEWRSLPTPPPGPADIDAGSKASEDRSDLARRVAELERLLETRR